MTDGVDERASEMCDAIAALERELTYSQLGWRRQDGEWSIAQVLEHLILTDTMPS
jgi:hypothetical protein